MNTKEFYKKLTAPIIWGNLLAMLVVVVLLCFGLKWWLSAYTNHGEGVEVPDLYGMTHQTAMERVEPEGLVVVVNDSTYIADMPAGAIVSQSPESGMEVKVGRVIYVTINSLTMPREHIPDLIDNCSYREAQARLKSLGFVLLAPKLIDGEKDWVYGIQYRGRNLVAGDAVPRESELTLVIGNGTAGEDISLEDTDDESGLSGYSEDDVDDFLEVIE
jgi:beta-lactam-binding protein with PASTA domain